MNGSLKFIVLKILSDGENSGYGIRKKIMENVNWSPSYGALFPMLSKMEELGLITSRRDGRRNVYRITKKGRGILSDMSSIKSKVKKRIMKNIKTLGFLWDVDAKTIQMMMSDDIDFIVTPYVRELHDVVMKAMIGKHEKNTTKKVEKIIKTATKEIREVLKHEKHN